MSAEFVASVIVACFSIFGLLVKFIFDIKRLQKEILVEKKDKEKIFDKFIETIKEILIPHTQKIEKLEKQVIDLDLIVKDNQKEILNLKNNDKETLINFEKQNRELGKFPPYGKMATISISSLNETIAYRVAKKIVKIIATV